MPTQAGLTTEVLNAALAGLEVQKRTIESHLEQVRAMLGIRAGGQKRRGRPPKAANVAAPGSEIQAAAPKMRFSAATRAKMAAAQRKRWAARNEPQQTPGQPATKKRRLIAAGRKRIIEATKKRWAAYKAKKAIS